MPKKKREKQSKEMKNSVQEEAIRELEEAILELEQFSRETKNSSIRSRLSFHIKELKKSPTQHPEPITLRAWLKMDQNRVVTAVPVARLTDKAKALIRGFLKDYKTLYLQGKVHGRITSENIIVYEGTAMLINRQNNFVANLDTIKADFAAIKTVISEMLGSDPCPKDLSHFLEIIAREELPTGALQAFIFNHPAFWSNNKIVRNVIAIKLSYYHCGDLNRTNWEDTASQIPTNVTVKWKSLVQKSSIYKTILDESPTNYDEFVDGLALLIFFRHCLMHAHKKRYALTQCKIADKLYALFPDFLVHFIEKTYCIADVREICMR